MRLRIIAWDCSVERARSLCDVRCLLAPFSWASSSRFWQTRPWGWFADDWSARDVLAMILLRAGYQYGRGGHGQVVLNQAILRRKVRCKIHLNHRRRLWRSGEFPIMPLSCLTELRPGSSLARLPTTRQAGRACAHQDKKDPHFFAFLFESAIQHLTPLDTHSSARRAWCHDHMGACVSTCLLAVKSVVVDNHQVKANFWDLAGAAEYFEVRNEFYRDAQGALLVFDVGNRSSFEALDAWVEEANKYVIPCKFEGHVQG